MVDSLLKDKIFNIATAQQMQFMLRDIPKQLDNLNNKVGRLALEIEKLKNELTAMTERNQQRKSG